MNEYQEALDEIEYELCTPATYDNPMPDRKCEREIEMLQGLIDKGERLKLHDLEADKDDLPPLGKMVLVYIKHPIRKALTVQMSWRDDNHWRNIRAKTVTYYKDKSVIGWREIPEYED